MKRTKVVDLLKDAALIGSEVLSKAGCVPAVATNMCSSCSSTMVRPSEYTDCVRHGQVYRRELKPVTTGSSICVRGLLVESQGKGQTCEIQAESLEVYGTADRESYPLQKKGHTLEFLREIAHLRPRTNTFGAVLRVRSASLLQSTSSLTNADSSISTHLSSQRATARVQELCFRSPLST